MATTTGISLEQAGLASVLGSERLRVPANQRNYAWEQTQVGQLLEDLTRAQREGEAHFLGTVVTIPNPDGALEVVDGQQRLATTALLLAAMRDHLRSVDEPMVVQEVERALTTTDLRRRELVPRIQLNVEDNEFFSALLSREDGAALPVARRTSHERIITAYQLCANHVVTVTASARPEQQGDVLVEWLEYLRHNANIVLLKVHDDANAYRMFETLNDRGLKTSQADLIKNYLFGVAGTRIREAQTHWSLMLGTLEALDDDDAVLDFLRYVAIMLTGYKRQAELYTTIKGLARTERPAVTLATDLDNLSNVYAATLNSEHAKWNEYPPSARSALQVLNLLDIKPLRALTLAVADSFSTREGAGAFRFLAALGTRLLLASSTRSASVEVPLADAARAVHGGEIASSKALREALRTVTPNDGAFVSAVSVAKVANARLARYYLRTLERAAAAEEEPYFIPNNDEVINLEHILPKNPEGNWPAWSEEERRDYLSRLGNLVLMRASQNGGMRSSSFEEKRAVFAESPYLLTKEVADNAEWSPRQVEHRQIRMAQFAPQAWPVA